MENIERMRTAMDNKRNIRNIAVIGQVGHGQTTLTDVLLARAGINSGDQATDKCEDEQLDGVTIKSTAVSLYYDLGPAWEDMTKGKPLLVNLTDSPPYVDCSHEAVAALRIADGALVVVDFVEGVCDQTDAALQQVAIERIKPVLMINKLDRAVFELQLTHEEIYQSVQNIVENVNAILATYTDDEDFVIV